MNTNFNVIISTIFDGDDFHGKAMVDIHGKPMIQLAYESAVKAGAGEIVIATDSPRVGMAAEEFGATVCMITEESASGYRVHAEAVDKMGWGDDVTVVCLPGDSPLMPADNINQVASNLVNNDEAECAVLYSTASQSAADRDDVVSMVVDASSYVLYMSHFAIPHVFKRADMELQYKCYIGLNACSAGLLRVLRNLTAEDMDVAEGIEEIKLLYNGMKIHADEAVRRSGQRVITEKDVETVLQQLSPQA